MRPQTILTSFPDPPTSLGMRYTDQHEVIFLKLWSLAKSAISINDSILASVCYTELYMVRVGFRLV